MPPDELKEMEYDLSRLSKEKNLYVKLHDLEKGDDCRGEEDRVKRLYDQTQRRWKEDVNREIPLVKLEDVAYTVSKMTGVPLFKLEEHESEKLVRMEEALHRRIIAQEEAIRAMSRPSGGPVRD